jgi:D,D-heptose 1,7-bisphosphate phosphatase
MKKAIFLDRDGTVIENVHYNSDPEKVRLLPYASEALHRLQANDYLLVLVSNQSGVALGFFSEAELQKINERVSDLLSPSYVAFDDIYYCMHYKHGIVQQYVQDCDCRKPMPGMILQAAQEHEVDLSQSWMIGDILDDVEAGTRAGCKTILLDNGNETEWKRNRYRVPQYMVKDLMEAADVILKYGTDEAMDRL